MKRVLLIFLISASFQTEASVFYVSTAGNDENNGDLNSPWNTWQKGFSSLKAGDTLYIRGGTYFSTGLPGGGYFQSVYISGKLGTKEKPFKVFAYPGETPVLDLSNLTGNNRRFGINLVNCSHWHLKGLTVQNLRAYSPSLNTGFRNNNCRNITFEMCISRKNDGAGFAQSDGGDGNNYINCDAHDNYDPLNGGEAGDGFIFGLNLDQSVITICRGCRSWNNSDDGFDTYGNEGTIKYYSCWAFDNGYGTDGDGAGFKLGKNNIKPLKTPQRILVNCLAYNNKGIGFDLSEGDIQVLIFNSVGFNNLIGLIINKYCQPSSIIRNNISFKNTLQNSIKAKIIQDHNSWNGLNKVSELDFKSLSDDGMAGPRNRDGKLPETNFLRLAPDSKLIDAGTYIGIPYYGKAPDIGAFETEFAKNVRSKNDKAGWLKQLFDDNHE